MSPGLDSDEPGLVELYQDPNILLLNIRTNRRRQLTSANVARGPLSFPRALSGATHANRLPSHTLSKPAKCYRQKKKPPPPRCVVVIGVLKSHRTIRVKASFTTVGAFMFYTIKSDIPHGNKVIPKVNISFVAIELDREFVKGSDEENKDYIKERINTKLERESKFFRFSKPKSP